MTALSANKSRDYNEGIPAQWGSYEVGDGILIYAGAALSMVDATGRAKLLAGTDPIFLGFAEQKVDMVNPASLTAGDLEVKVRMKGEVALIVTGVSDQTNHGDTVYGVTDENTFTLTSTSALAIGKVKRVVNATTGLCIVAFESTLDRSI